MKQVERHDAGGESYAVAMATTTSQTMCISSSSSESLAFTQRYLHALIPALRSNHSRNAPFTHHDKASAVKLAANTSLAVSVKRNPSWRQELIRDLMSRPASSKPERTISTVTARPRVINRGAIRGVPHALRPQASSATFFKCARPAAKRHQRYQTQYYGKHRPASFGLHYYVRSLRSSTSCRKSMEVKERSQDRPSPSPSSDMISEEQVVRLGGLLPGGQKLEVPRLLEEAAHYILALKMQVEALQFLSQSVSM